MINGVLAATLPDEKPLLIIIEYDPDKVKSFAFVEAARERDGHADLVGL